MESQPGSQQTSEARRQCDFEAWHKYEYARLLRNELTDASERLTVPMKNTINFLIDDSGEIFSEHGEKVKTLLLRGYQQVESALPYHPDYAFELNRRAIDIRNFELMSELRHHDMLVEFSPIPDAVKNSQTTIAGYDRSRLKMIVRVSQRIGRRIETVHFSLDGSNSLAMAAAAMAIGHNLPLSGSEAILATPAVLRERHDLDASDIAETIRQAYDNSLSQQYGGKWYAGRRPMSLNNGLAYIEKQTDLIDQHMQILSGINERISHAQEKLNLQEMARYDFAAALDDRLHGKYIQSVSDAGDMARSESRRYDGDCPVDAGAINFDPAQASQAQLNMAGLMQGKVEGIMACVRCPFCKKTVDAIKTARAIICPIDKGCGTVLNLLSGEKSNLKNSPSQLSKTTLKAKKAVPAPKPAASWPPVKDYDLKWKISVGGADQIAVHKTTGHVLSEEQTRQLLQSAAQTKTA